MQASPRLSVQTFSAKQAFLDDPAATISRLGAIGFDFVELFGVYVEREEEVRAGLTASGVQAPTAHFPYLSEDPAEAFRAAKALGVHTIIDPKREDERWASVDGIRSIAEQINRLVPVAAEHGLALGYHNHADEIVQRFGDTTALEVLAENLAPEVVLEIDTYWAAVGGADVVELIDRLGPAVKYLHIKDGPITDDRWAQQPAGQGLMPIAEILAAAPSVELAVVEFDRWSGDVFAAIAESHAYLTTLGLH